MSSSGASAGTAEPVRARFADGIAIVGPTASGKTALAIEVARRIRGEIVSMDSRQVFRGLDIGTAKATPAERALVPHHGLDLVEPDERFSAGRFADYARARVREIHQRGAVPVLAGGTGFFLRALTQPLFREPPLDDGRRRAIADALRDLDDETLRAYVAALDPVTHASLASGGGRQRILRALEIALLTGRALSWWHEHTPALDAPLDLLIVLIDIDRAEMDRRTDARVHAMVDAGLVAEVRALLDAGVHPEAPGMTATGYREIVAHLRGEVSLDEAVRQIQQATRQYARRQLTWFRNQLGADPMRLDATRPADELAAAIVRAWEVAPGP